MEETQKIRPLVLLQVGVSLALLSIVVVAFVLFLWERLPIQDWLSKISYLEVKEVRIAAAWPLTPEKVKAYLPGIEGKNILLIQPQKWLPVLQSKPWVGAVTFKKEYPDRLLISVESRLPRAVVIFQGVPFYVDAQGKKIDRMSASYAKDFDLPTISFEKEAYSRWDLGALISVVNELPLRWKNAYKISQTVLEDFPYFRVYLSRPQVELKLDFDHWQNEIHQVPNLLRNPLPPLKQVRRINLVFPKKAIVSPSLSN